MNNYLSRLNRGSRCTLNYSFLIANCSFPQGYVNPPIRGSIVGKMAKQSKGIESQSPYKGFNRFLERRQYASERESLNPPIRGSIASLLQGVDSDPVSIPL